MKTFLAILIAFVLAVIIFLVGIKQKWWKNPFEMPADGGDGGTVGGNPTDCDPSKKGYQINGVLNTAKCGTPTNGGQGEQSPNLPSGSLLVNLSELTNAPVIDNQYYPFDASAQAKLFNKATLLPVAVAPLIHYVAPAYPASPLIYWWYKNGHYTFIKTEAGTHYYKKSILPNEIKLIVKRTDSCYPDWYLSGSKYKLDREENLDGELRWCVYKKQ